MSDKRIKVHRMVFEMTQYGLKPVCRDEKGAAYNSVLCPCQPVVIVEDKMVLYVHCPEEQQGDPRVARILEERKRGLDSRNE